MLKYNPYNIKLNFHLLIDLLFFFSDCECDNKGSSGLSCDDVNGKCTCKLGYIGDKCDSCLSSYYRDADGTCKGTYIYIFKFKFDIYM